MATATSPSSQLTDVHQVQMLSLKQQYMTYIDDMSDSELENYDMNSCQTSIVEEVVGMFGHTVSDQQVIMISATIEDVVHYEEHQETELLLHVHGILRQSLPLFTVTSPRRLRRSSPGIRWTADVGGPPLDQLPSPPTDPGGLEPKRYGGRVIAHHKCGIRRPQEPDELFLFLGRVKLRRARLQCAPRLDDFHAVWETALKNGENPCLLD